MTFLVYLGHGIIDRDAVLVLWVNSVFGRGIELLK